MKATTSASASSIKAVSLCSSERGPVGYFSGEVRTWSQEVLTSQGFLRLGENSSPRVRARPMAHCAVARVGANSAELRETPAPIAPSASSWAKAVAMKAEHNALAALADIAKSFLMKCPQPTLSGARSTLVIAALRPSCASEVTNFRPPSRAWRIAEEGGPKGLGSETRYPCRATRDGHGCGPRRR